METAIIILLSINLLATIFNSVSTILIFKKQTKIMTKEEELQAAIQELKDASAAIAAKIQAFIDGGVTDQSLADLQAVADQLKGEGA